MFEAYLNLELCALLVVGVVSSGARGGLTLQTGFDFSRWVLARTMKLLESVEFFI